ncbi:MAG: galactose oxidase [Flavobacterium sp.]|nr:galactose oxidase [Flavobacterium sp.]
MDIKNNLPIENVNVTLKRINASTLTNEKGKFKLSISTRFQETDSIYFSHIGYAGKTISLAELQKNDFLIFLDEKFESLESIILSGNKPLKSKIAFTKLTPSKYALFSFGSILKDNKIYVIGGDASFKTDAWKKVQYEKPDPTIEDYLRELSFQFSGQSYKGNLLVYDIETGLWEISKLKFRKRAYHNLNEYNEKIYVLGGKSVSANGVFEYLDNKIEVFDIKNQTITIDNTNPHQASEFASFTHNDNIIIMGGSTKMKENGSKEYSNKVHSYDINSGFWYELSSMPTSKETNGVLVKDKIYLIGGFNTKPLSTVESFDLLTEKWKTEGELFYGLNAPAITQNDGIIYFFENEKIFTYDTNTKQLKEYLINLPMKASKLYFSKNKLYLLGGYIENYYSKYPSPNLFSIDIIEFENTKPNRSKFLQILNFK